MDFCEVGFQTKYMVSKALLGHGLYWNQALCLALPNNVGPWFFKLQIGCGKKPIAKGLPCLKTVLKFYCLIFFSHIYD
jgi:hypothetical protein